MCSLYSDFFLCYVSCFPMKFIVAFNVPYRYMRLKEGGFCFLSGVGGGDGRKGGL